MATKTLEITLKAKEGTIFYKILEKFPEAFQVLDPESSRKKNGNTKKMLMNVIASVFGDPLTDDLSKQKEELYKDGNGGVHTITEIKEWAKSLQSQKEHNIDMAKAKSEMDAEEFKKFQDAENKFTKGMVL